MIEIIYNQESEKNEQETCFQIPNNIRQIGESKGTLKIYVEDYAYTFLRKISRGSKEGKFAILLGEYHWKQGTRYLFIKSALQITDIEVSEEHLDLDDKVWGQAYENGKKYFPDQEILGWFLGLPGFSMQPNDYLVKTHLDYFAGNDKVLFLVEPGEWDEAFYVFEDGQMRRQTGYYIYYQKNEPMQNYMIEMCHNKSIEATEDVPDRAVINFRNNVINEPKEEPKQAKRNLMVGTYVALAVLAIGVTVYSKSERLQRMVLFSFSDKKSGNESVLDSSSQETVGSGTNLEDLLPDLPDEGSPTPEVTDDDGMAKETGGMSLREYVIQKGDTLTSISREQFGSLDMIDEICLLNDISVDDYIYAGQKIWIPAEDKE